MDRWRGRRLAGLALAAMIAVSLGGAGAAARDEGQRWIVVRTDGGDELARAPLPPNSRFALRYRNSVYGSLAEERFRVASNHLVLEGVAADEVAVLEEYYAVTGRPRATAGPRNWVATHRAPAIDLPLRVQATPLGERTLLVEGGELALWRLPASGDSTLVVLWIEGSE